jgi:hypothetical protein
VLLIVGAILSIYISDGLGCLIEGKTIPLLTLVTFASILTITILGAVILKIKRR